MPQVQRRLTGRKAEQAQHPQPLTHHRCLSARIGAGRRHHEGHVLQRHRNAVDTGELKWPPQHRRGLARDDHPDRSRPRRKQRMGDGAEHLLPDPVAHLSDDPRLVFQPPIRRSMRPQVGRKRRDRPELPSARIKLHLMTGKNLLIGSGKLPVPLGLVLVCLDLQAQLAHAAPHPPAIGLI